MTKAGAISKAKRYTEKMENMSVVTDGYTYEVIHTEYLDEYVEDGWYKVASFKYEGSKVVKC